MFHSTRSKEMHPFSFCVNKGLASDGGLFIFDEIKTLDISKLVNLNYKELAFIVLRNLIDDFSDEEIKSCIDKSYNEINFKEKIIDLKNMNNYSYLELFYGPTAAFKDFALTILPNFMVVSREKLGIKSLSRIVVATSGDTGSATLSGFLNQDNFKVTVLYPNNLVSPLQEKQMLLYSKNNNQAYAYEGNFDDCQRIAKELAITYQDISSANSINLGRLFPQVVYYFYGYLNLVKNNKIKLNEEINVTVPTGNFGNILAGYIAKKMGLPINKLICASNSNNVLYDFINTGVYDRNRCFVKTYSPSMDILVSSNIERLIYLFYKDTEKVNELFNEFNKTGKIVIKEYKELFKDFVSFYTTNDEIIKEIKNEYKDNGYLIDPHTAVALNCYHKYQEKTRNKIYNLIVSTASPYKFDGAFIDAGIKLNYDFAPMSIKEAIKCNKERKVLDNTLSIKEIGEIING